MKAFDTYMANIRTWLARCWCDGVEDCLILARNVFRFDNCIAARKAVMDKCFRGCDAAHKTELAKEEAGRLKCMQALGRCKIEACPR